MKILVVVPSYKPAYVYGGPIESVAKLCEGLVHAGQSVDVYTTTANGASELDVVTASPVDVDGVPVTYFKRITKDHTHISPDLWKSLNKTVKQYDIVLIQSWWSPLVVISARIAQNKGVRVVISPRGMLSDYILSNKNGLFKKLIHRFIGKKALSKSVFHATSQSEYDECTRLINNWKGFVVPNILTLPPVHPATTGNDVFTMVFMSRIHPKKGLELLFEAASLCNFPWKLKIAGSGDENYISNLKQLAQQKNIADKVEWLGWKNRDEKFNELMRADLMVLTSYNENFANIVIESLHVGTAVLISEEVALSAMIMQSGLGWVTKLGVEQIKDKLTEAFNNKQKREEIREKATDYIAENFSEQKLIAQYIDNYKQIL